LEYGQLEQGRTDVYSFDWSTLENPFGYASDGTTEEILIDLLLSKPDLAAEVLQRVKVRGMAQVIFRKLLLRVYKRQCAFCGLTFEDALQAAHLIRWSEASKQQRLDPRNGLLLCSTHHSLFDAGLLTITDFGTIMYCAPKLLDRPYSLADKSSTVTLHGQQALLPQSKLHRPALWAIALHHKVHQLNELQ
jgi:putative restriction endonuclease